MTNSRNCIAHRSLKAADDSQGRSQRSGRYGGRQQSTSFEPRETTRSQGAMQEALRGLQSLQTGRSQTSMREGQRVNAEVISNDGRNVVVRLIDNQNEELRFQQPAYPRKPGESDQGESAARGQQYG